MSFDAIAPHYRWLEPLLAGRKLDRCRTAHLSRLAPPRSVLIMGQGPGKFLVPFRQRFPHARITCVDSSKRMLAMAQHRLSAHNCPLEKVSFIHADALNYNYPLATFELIVTHFFLDCFAPEQLRRLVANLAQAATPTATWLLSDFSVPKSGLPRLRARAIHGLMYAFFRAATNLSARRLSPPDEFLRAENFHLQHRTSTNLGLLHSDLWSRLPES
jgi:ubiquinone/menaquinone biosynthesis C-methylase UbiE